MDCKTVELYLYNYLDNELTDQECVELEEHFKTCDQCRNLYNFELEFSRHIKSNMKMEEIKAPLDLKEKIATSHQHKSIINYNIFTFKGLLNVAVVLVSITFISKFSMGYSSLPDNYCSMKNKIKISSNNEDKIRNWMVKNKHENLEPLQFNSHLNITPLGIAFNKKLPVIVYHYKGNQVVYRNIPAQINTTGFEKYTIKDKTYFIKQNPKNTIALWQNNKSTSLLSSNMNKKELKTILKAIR